MNWKSLGLTVFLLASGRDLTRAQALAPAVPPPPSPAHALSNLAARMLVRSNALRTNFASPSGASPLAWPAPRVASAPPVSPSFPAAASPASPPPLPSSSPAISQFQVTFTNPPGIPRPMVPPGAAPLAGYSNPIPNLPPALAAPAPLTALAFDAEAKESNAKVGQENAEFTFHVTNVSPAEVLIRAVRTSCGCTVAQLPSQPWNLAPGASGPIKVTVDLRGKRGVMMKSVHIDSSAGFKSLMVRVNVPDLPVTNTVGAQVMQAVDRQKNQILALSDRQAVFRGDCARCHLEPARGRMGPALYYSACSICHDAPNRASMVPDLRRAKAPRDINYWREWITQGKAGSLMPAWAMAHGGPLNPQQVDSLVDYLYRSFPRNPIAPPRPVVSAPPAGPSPLGPPPSLPPRP